MVISAAVWFADYVCPVCLVRNLHKEIRLELQIPCQTTRLDRRSLLYSVSIECASEVCLKQHATGSDVSPEAHSRYIGDVTVHNILKDRI